jgi:hypothetical protein
MYRLLVVLPLPFGFHYGVPLRATWFQPDDHHCVQHSQRIREQPAHPAQVPPCRSVCACHHTPPAPAAPWHMSSSR